MTLVALAFGSNLGDRESNIKKAIDYIVERKLLTDIKKSSLLNTEALLKPHSPESWNIDFLNCVITGRATLGLHSLLKELQDIESIIGIRSKERWAPRIIDIDILLYGDMCISDNIITVPHIEIFNRDFIVELLAEVSPDLLYPKNGTFYKKSFKQIAEKFYEKAEV